MITMLCVMTKEKNEFVSGITVTSDGITIELSDAKNAIKIKSDKPFGMFLLFSTMLTLKNEKGIDCCVCVCYEDDHGLCTANIKSEYLKEFLQEYVDISLPKEVTI